jgi:hypothetical protein
MVAENIIELRNLVYEVFEVTDYNLYFKAFDAEKYYECTIMAETYMEKARDAFFATLQKEVCDIEKAIEFHSAFKVFQMSLEYAAKKYEITRKSEIDEDII